MSRRVHTIWAILMSVLTALSGCSPQQPYYLRETGDLSHYLGVATDIEYPDVQAATLDEVEQSLPPYTLTNLKFASYWDLCLEEAIQNALQNAKAMKSLGYYRKTPTRLRAFWTAINQRGLLKASSTTTARNGIISTVEE